jgi:hypothetical protein
MKLNPVILLVVMVAASQSLAQQDGGAVRSKPKSEPAVH